MARSRLFVEGYADQVDLSVTKELPWNAELIQTFVKVVNGSTTTSNLLTITKIDAVATPARDMRCVEIDMAQFIALNTGQSVCRDVFQFAKGDSVNINYGSNDDLEIYVECVFREAIGG